MDFTIIPKTFTVENREAGSADDAIIDFATGMDSDMNNYFQAVPTEDADKTNADSITKLIKASRLSASDCSKIFRALDCQPEVLAGSYGQPMTYVLSLLTILAAIQCLKTYMNHLWNRFMSMTSL